MEKDSFVDLEKVWIEILQGKVESGIGEFKDDYKRQWTEVRFERPLLEELLRIIEQQKPKKVIKTSTSSQACPVCRYNVNGKHCSNCGQRVSYSY